MLFSFLLYLHPLLVLVTVFVELDTLSDQFFLKYLVIIGSLLLLFVSGYRNLGCRQHRPAKSQSRYGDSLLLYVFTNLPRALPSFLAQASTPCCHFKVDDVATVSSCLTPGASVHCGVGAKLHSMWLILLWSPLVIWSLTQSSLLFSFLGGPTHLFLGSLL